MTTGAIEIPSLEAGSLDSIPRAQKPDTVYSIPMSTSSPGLVEDSSIERESRTPRKSRRKKRKPSSPRAESSHKTHSSSSKRSRSIGRQQRRDDIKLERSNLTEKRKKSSRIYRIEDGIPDISESVDNITIETPAAFTKLSREEFEMLADQFKLMKNDETITYVSKDRFSASLGLLGDTTNQHTAEFANMIFNVFDDNHDGMLEFPEFLYPMAILMRGSTDQKLQLAFTMCDTKANGKIQRSDLLHVISTMYNILTNLGLPVSADAAVVADNIFHVMDAHRNGSVTLCEYKDAAKKHPNILKGLGLFDPKEEPHIHFDLPSTGTSITFGHARWGLVLNIMIGLRLSVFFAEKSPPFLLPENYTERQSFRLTSEFSGEISILDIFGNKEAVEDNEFVSYAPVVFKCSREYHQISEQSFLLSLGPEQLFGNMLCGTLASMKGSASAGKSGSFFFTSHDGRYLVKTIYWREKVSFERMLPAYFKHIMVYQHSLLNRIHGCHRIGSIPFVVLENIFATVLPIDEVYDLKGSEYQRTNPTGKGVLKDLDFKRKLNLTPQMKEKFLKQIDADSKALEQLQLIDYSLLLGIHYVDQHKEETYEEVVLPRYLNNEFAAHNGGILSADGKEVYFVGIIDYLTVYGRRKTAETLLRGVALMQGLDKISTVPPGMYGERFRQFMRSICV